MFINFGNAQRYIQALYRKACIRAFKETYMNSQQKHNEMATTIAVDEVLWRSGLALTAAELKKILNILDDSAVVDSLSLYGKTVRLTAISYVLV